MPLHSSHPIATIVIRASGAAQAIAIHQPRPATPFSTGSAIIAVIEASVAAVGKQGFLRRFRAAR